MKSIKTRIKLVDILHPDNALMHTIDRHLLRSMVVQLDQSRTDDAFIRKGTILHIAGNRYEVTDIDSCFYNETKGNSSGPGGAASNRTPYNSEITYFLSQLS